MRGLSAWVFGLVVALGAQGAEAKYSLDWLEITSPHFIVRSNADRDRATALITDLERFRVVMEQITSVDFTDDPTPPLLIYAFETTKQYHRDIRAFGSLGFYENRHEGAQAFLTLEPLDKRELRPDGREVLIHEYTHHLLHQVSPLKYPRWYDEGLAEYLSTIEFRGNLAIIGGGVADRAMLLEHARWIPFQEIISAHGQYLEGGRNGLSNVSMQYSQGWLLTHFLHGQPELWPKMNAFLMQANLRTDRAEQIFKEVFGRSPKQVGKEVKAYWKGRQLRLLQTELPDSSRMSDIQVRVMPEAEARLQVAEARFLAGSKKTTAREFRRAFSQALADGIRAADMCRYLAEIAMIREEYDEARAYAGRLAELLPDTPRAPYLTAMIGRLEAVDGDRDEALTGDAVTEFRRGLRRAIRRQKTFVPALYNLADTYAWEGEEVSDEAFLVIDAARTLRPDSADIEVTYSKLLAKSGRFDEAEQTLRNLIAWSTHRRQERDLTKELRAIVEMRKAAESGASPQ